MANKQIFHSLDLIVLNLFANTDLYIEMKPRYYVLNPVEFWSENIDEERHLDRLTLFKNIVEKTTWNIILFVPIVARKSPFLKDILSKNKNLNVHFFNQTPVEGITGLNHFFFKTNAGMPRPHNSLIPCLILAINMRYNEIFLTGAEHSWLKTIWVSDENEALLTQKHFYDKDTAKSSAMKTKIGDKRPLHMILHKFMLAFKGYFEIESYSKYMKCKIYNTTPRSYIDAFERKKLKDIQL
ncbi:MAG: hypothetical protein JXR53_07960 [Bacteroidales bacterium]|nr:hypothetical protein [Bacteroidales bacterium]